MYVLIILNHNIFSKQDNLQEIHFQNVICPKSNYPHETFNWLHETHTGDTKLNKRYETPSFV